ATSKEKEDQMERSRSSSEEISEKWKDFPSAIRRTAWEIVQSEQKEEQIELFKGLVTVMKGRESGEASDERLKNFLDRAHKLMDAYLDLTRRYGWIDMPLTGQEPYLDGTFPTEEEEEGLSDEKMNDTVEKGFEDTVIKKEIKEEIMDEEVLQNPAPTSIQEKCDKAKEKKEEDDWSTRDYSRYWTAAMERTINGTNFTASEKGAIKQALTDMLFKGLPLRTASEKYTVAPRRLVAFATRTKQMCKTMR
ncbi:hypothetical protein PMAYCL1PPCAC_14283, partial [Pristionchus mayeri]